jgi:protease YdgD
MRPILLVLLLCAAIAESLGPANALDLERRRMLTSQEHIPWRGVGRVNVATYSERGMCTGTLIDTDLVVTAAHCVFSERTGKLHNPKDVHFVAGWRRGTAVAHRKAEEIVVHPGYRHGTKLSIDQISADLALIRLDRAIEPTEVAPFRISPMPRRSQPITLISYRRDRAHALTRQDGCKTDGVQGGVMVLRCDVTFGASGSPVFAEIGGEKRIIAVISAKGVDKTTRRQLAFAVRVDAAMPTVLAKLP